MNKENLKSMVVKGQKQNEMSDMVKCHINGLTLTIKTSAYASILEDDDAPCAKESNSRKC